MATAILEPVLLTTEELATFLKCSKRHIYTLTERKIVPVVRVGDAFRFDRAKVLAALENN